MFTTHEVISEKGLEIPLPLLAQYGVQLGARVKVEFGPNGIFVALPITDPHRIEVLALRLTLRYVGDAATVKAEPDPSPLNPGGWRVGVYAAEATEPAGYLVFSQIGEFLPEFSTRFEVIRGTNAVPTAES